MIAAENITKKYGYFTALERISFEIYRGQIVGFLGQNGAGKTTLMRILTGYLSASDGKAFIAGEEVRGHSLFIKKKIGYLPENPPLYLNMPVKDYLTFAARLKDVPKDILAKRVDRVMQECQLTDVRHKVIGILSRGYKQRVGIAQAIVNDPDILILDEPTNGLDPVQIIQVRKLIKSFEHKRTVIVSTHILSEIEQVAQRIIMLKNGRIIADQNTADLLKGPQEQKRTLEEVFLGFMDSKETISE